MRGDQFARRPMRSGRAVSPPGIATAPPAEMPFRRAAIEAGDIHHVGEALGGEVHRALADGARRAVVHHGIGRTIGEQRTRDVEGGIDDGRRGRCCVVHFAGSGWRAADGRREVAALHALLIFVERALQFRRRQRQAHRQMFQPRLAVHAAHHQLLELLDAGGEAEQRPGIGGAELEQQQAAVVVGDVRRGAVDRAHVVHGDRAGPAGERDRRVVVHIVVRGIHRAAEDAVGVVVVDRTAMAAGHDHQRAVRHLHVVEHHADRGEVVVGVRIERPVLVPFHRRAEAGALQVELGGVEADVRSPQVLQHGEDLRMAHQARVFRMMLVRRLDAADARVVRRVAVLEVVDLVVRCHAAGAFDEFIGDTAQAEHLVRAQDVGHDDGAGLVVLVDLGLGQHGVLRSPQTSGFRSPCHCEERSDQGQAPSSVRAN